MPPSLPFPSSVFSFKFCFSTIIWTVLVHCKIVMVSLCSVLCQSPCRRRKFFVIFFKCHILTNWLFQSKNTNIRRYLLNPSFKIHVSSSLEIERTFTPWGRQVLMILIADLVFVLVRVVNVKFVHQIASLCSQYYIPVCLSNHAAQHKPGRVETLTPGFVLNSRNSLSEGASCYHAAVDSTSFCRIQFCLTVGISTSCSPSLAQSTWNAYLEQEEWSSIGISSYQPIGDFYFIIIFIIIIIIIISFCVQLWSWWALWGCLHTQLSWKIFSY